MSSGKVVLGVLAGLAAGALLGILLAPDKGSETRKKLKENAGDYADELKKKLNKFVETVTTNLNRQKPKPMIWWKPENKITQYLMLFI